MSTDFLPALTASRFGPAIKVLDSQLAAVDPGSTGAIPLLLDRAVCNEKLGMHRKALKDYNAALSHNPTHLVGTVGKGRVLFAMGKKQEAEALWQRALQLYSPGAAHVIIEVQQLLSGQAASAPAKSAHVPAPVSRAPHASPSPPATSLPNGSARHTPAKLVQQINSRRGSNAAIQMNGTAHGEDPSSVLAMQDQAHAVGLAVSQINAGQHDEALILLDEVIANARSPNFSAHLVRGTGRALKRDLTGAVEDFSAAIKLMPSYQDAWKRRGQALSALGDLEGAVKDFQKCLDLKPAQAEEGDIRVELGQLLRRTRDIRTAEVHCRAAVRMLPKNATAWLHLGLALMSLGDLAESVAALTKATKLEPGMQDAWFGLAHCEKEIGHVSEALYAFNKGFALDQPNQPSIGPMRILAHMYQCMGEHTKAIDMLTRALKSHSSSGSDEETPRVDCLFLRGACHHALGYLKKAVQDYQRAFTSSDQGLPEESRQLLVLAYYQKELAQHMFGNLDRPLSHFCADRELNPVFKELWCKKASPSTALTGDYMPQPRIPQTPPDPPERPDPHREAILVQAADSMGALLQYSTQGFVVNKRQRRMGGLAAIEFAQELQHLVAEKRAGRTVTVSRGASGTDAAHPFGWRDAMDLLVKWRQLSEPNDQVIWVDLLTKAEFEAGFGSHTPMFSGQTKCVRYHMNFARGLALFRKTALLDGYVHNADSKQVGLSYNMREDMGKAQTAEEMHAAIGFDCWVVVPIHSPWHSDETLEGTRLTLVQIKGQPDAYDFSIRTPVTPPRWRQYDQELAGLWEAVVEAMVSADLLRVADATLRYAYLWYNFMPLARGTAVVGYIMLLGTFLAAGMPITSPAPKDYQIDWEAILSQECSTFITSVSAWLYPPTACPDEAEPLTSPRWDAGVLPNVRQLLPTLRNRLEALNGPELPRI